MRKNIIKMLFSGHGKQNRPTYKKASNKEIADVTVILNIWTQVFKRTTYSP